MNCFNNTSNLSCVVVPNLKFKYPTYMVVLLSMIYGLIFILAILGNMAVLLTVIRHTGMRTVVNIFICNLSVADILLAVIILPSTLLQNILHDWPFGSFMCHAVPYLQGVSVCASVATLTVISFDRFVAICFPMRRLFNKKTSTVAINIIWITSAVILLPWAIYYQLLPARYTLKRNSTVYMRFSLLCYLKWSEKKEYFLGVTFILLYVIPLILMTIFYSAIGLKVWRRIKTEHSKANKKERKVFLNQATGGMDRRKSVRLVKMLLTVVIFFAITWLPLYLTMVLYHYLETEFWLKYARSVAVTYLMPIWQVMAASNSCINPLIYYKYSKNFHDGIQSVIFCKSNRNLVQMTNNSAINNNPLGSLRRNVQSYNYESNGFKQSCKTTPVTLITTSSKYAVEEV